MILYADEISDTLNPSAFSVHLPVLKNLFNHYELRLNDRIKPFPSGVLKLGVVFTLGGFDRLFPAISVEMELCLKGCA